MAFTSKSRSGVTPPRAWPHDVVDELRRLARLGMSARLIAEALPGAYSRNAVIGKLSRIDQAPGRPKPKPRPGKNGRAARAGLITAIRRQAKKAAAAAVELPIAGQAAPGFTGKPLVELNAGDCRFPLGPTAAPVLLFCGAPAIEGRAWCGYHLPICYASMRARG